MFEKKKNTSCFCFAFAQGEPCYVCVARCSITFFTCRCVHFLCVYVLRCSVVSIKGNHFCAVWAALDWTTAVLRAERVIFEPVSQSFDTTGIYSNSAVQFVYIPFVFPPGTCLAWCLFQSDSVMFMNGLQHLQLFQPDTVVVLCAVR